MRCMLYWKLVDCRYDSRYQNHMPLTVRIDYVVVADKNGLM